MAFILSSKCPSWVKKETRQQSRASLFVALVLHLGLEPTLSLRVLNPGPRYRHDPLPSQLDGSGTIRHLPLSDTAIRHSLHELTPFWQITLVTTSLIHHS